MDEEVQANPIPYMVWKKLSISWRKSEKSNSDRRET